MKTIEQMSHQEQSFRCLYRAYLRAKLDKENMIAMYQMSQDKLIKLLDEEYRKAMDEWQRNGATHDDVLMAIDEMNEYVNEEVRSGRI